MRVSRAHKALCAISSNSLHNIKSLDIHNTARENNMPVNKTQHLGSDFPTKYGQSSQGESY